MASDPPGGSALLPEGWNWSDVGHGALDIAGLVPGIGEPADLANAAWLAAEANYLDAGLSVISMVPVVGDAIGKGGKLAEKGAVKLAGPALDALKKMDFAKVLEPLASNPKLAPHIDEILNALEGWRYDVRQRAGDSTISGITKCPHGARSTSRTYSMIDPGPLPSHLAETFSAGKYREVIAEQDIVLKRVGNAETELGQFFSTESASSAVQARIDRAIPGEWEKVSKIADQSYEVSTAKAIVSHEYEVLIPKRTKMYVGEIGAQKGFYVGGAQQIVVEAPWTKGAKIVPRKYWNERGGTSD